MKRFGIAGLLLLTLVLFSQAFAYPTLNSFRTVAPPITANGTLNDVHSGKVLTNLGATGAITVTLQRATPGLHVTFSLAVAQDVNFAPQSGNQILGLTNNVGDVISSDAVAGSAIQLVAIDATNWVPIAKVGTWSDATP